MMRTATMETLTSARRAKSESGEVSVSSFAALLMPSLAGIVFAVTLLHVLFLSAGTTTLFRDSDAGWHVRNGEAILTTGVPKVDPFSYSREGAEWHAWEWLSDVMFGGAHQLAGLAGVALLAAIIIAGTAWGAVRLSLALGGNLFFTAASMVLLLGVTSLHWLARPHIFSWGLALVFLAIAELERRRPSQLLYALPLLAVLWANLHGSFLLGPGILFLYALGEALDGDRIRARVRLFGASLACLIATSINPYGWRLHEHVFSYLQNTYLMDHISEFGSYSFHTAGAFYVELFLLVCAAGVLLMLKQRAFGAALLGVALLHLSLYSARHLPTAAVLLLPLAVAAFTREAQAWPRLQSMLAYSDRLRMIDRKIWSVAPVILTVVACTAALQASANAGRVGFDAKVFPVKAADYLGAHANDARVFAKDQWGGYLIYRFGGTMKVFIDGRSDFYGQSFLQAYAEVAEARPGWNSVLKQHGVQFVMAAPNSALASVLQLSSSWKPVYRDAVAVVYEKSDGTSAVIPTSVPPPQARFLPALLREAFSLVRVRSLVLILVVLAAGLTDLRYRQIPNWITVPGAVLGLVFHLLQSGPYGAVLWLAGAALGFGILIAFYAAGGMGAGDVKLFSAVGALAGPQPLVMIFVFTGLLGGVVAVCAAIRHRRIHQTFIPYGAVIAGGTLLALPIIG